MTQPVNATVTENTPAKFSVKATGENLKYQWYIATSENGSYWRPWLIPSGTIAVDFTGLTESELTFKKTKLSYSGKMKFKCVISNAAGTVESNEVFLYVTGNEAPSAPVITKQPASAAVKEGENVTFAVTATGDGIAYRWYKNGAAIDGATGAAYTFAAALADNGAVFRCEVSNSAGKVMSNEATLTVTEKNTPKPMLLLGNVSEEGKGSAVSVSDARLVLRAAVALESFTGIKAFVADVDGKDGITVADARLTLRMAVSLDPLKYGNNY